MITQKQIDRMLTVALRTPTGDNCQPWRIKVELSSNQPSVSIGIDLAAAKHVLCNRHTSTLLSLGMLLEHLQVAAQEEKLGITFEILEADFEKLVSAEFWMKVAFFPITPSSLSSDDKIAISSAELLQRRTQRTPFSWRPIASPTIEALLALNNQNNDCRVHFLPMRKLILRPKFLAYLLRSESYVIRSKPAFQDVFRWSRFNRREVEESKTGMSIENMGLPAPAARLLKVLAKATTGRRTVSLVMSAGHVFQTLASCLMSGGFLYVSAKMDSVATLVDTGRLIVRQWAWLNGQKIAYQPHNISVIGAHAMLIGRPLKLGVNGADEHFSVGADILTTAFTGADAKRGNRNIELPIWLCRIGYPLSFFPIPEGTERKALCDIVEYSVSANNDLSRRSI
jgi:hypothetical protein